MPAGAITGHIDVALLALYAFWLFFAGLLFYLSRESRREGFPLLPETPAVGRAAVKSFTPKPKIFRLPHGGIATAPRHEVERELPMRPTEPWPGAPFVPTADPLTAGVGPGSWCERIDEPDVGFDDAKPKIVPLRTQPSFFLAWEDPDPRGMTLVGADGKVAGTIKDVWIDRSETVIRFLEAEVTGGTHPVLIPWFLSRIKKGKRRVEVISLLAHQFAGIPNTRDPETITLREEDRIYGYFGGGQLYATPQRAEPLV